MMMRFVNPRRWPPLAAIIFAAALFLTPVSPVDAQLADPRLAQPEAATGGTATSGTMVSASHHMIVSANPLASDAGREILRAGGSAVDAAIAVQMVLTLVEPQSSGLGGGAFLVHWNAKNEAIESIDGRETAPLAARPDRFLLPNGEPRPFDDLASSPLSVGVPGVLRALELAHRKHGKLPWARLFEPAIALAENGFAVSPRLSALLIAQGASFFNPAARALYFDDGQVARPAGYQLKNPALAATLRTIAGQGADAFYLGSLANAILWTLQDKAGPDKIGAPVDMTLADLAGYQAKIRDPLCPHFRGFKVCSVGAPSSGGITMGMVLGMFDNAHAPVAATSSGAAAAAQSTEPLPVLRDHLSDIALLAEAEKLAYADRDQFIADPDFVAQTANLLDPTYLAERAKLIDPAHPIAKARPGSPPYKASSLFGLDATVEQSGTSHISIVDDDGNALAMTTSVQTAFGSGLMVGGFLLNCELTDFSFKFADANANPIANRIEGGKRPRSSMAPTIILDPAGQLFAVLGSPGGSNIILYNLKAIVCLIEWHCSVELSASLPNFGSRNGPFEVERGTLAQSGLGAAFTASGSTVTPIEMTSGLAIIERRDGHFEGSADPRREGTALGD